MMFQGFLTLRLWKELKASMGSGQVIDLNWAESMILGHCQGPELEILYNI